MPPVTSLTATTLAPCSASRRAGDEPTLPKPWIATVAPLDVDAAMRRSASLMVTTHAPAGGLRRGPREPPSATGLPVTTPGTV